ncbi:hypothetical protein [Flammeovirga aprica]|uniref:Glycosyl transferase n=1 Tax=Flammeovirga aprica JL-4 TaxID=694437 RepID=A0A7X9RY66_9BACT|nr:hypothetical protein [Flammeovirga aprica]NME70953.1 hypothetical protein [Flammeovirga aprica JL-4]
MKLFYVLGGGLGHLTRVKRLISTLGIESDFLIFSTAWATKVFPSDQCIIIDTEVVNDKGKLFDYLLHQLIKHAVTDLYIDTFPLGLFKEIDFNLIPKQCRTHYIARYLKWNTYIQKSSFQNVKFDTSYIIDFMNQEQFRFIKSNSNTVHHYQLKPSKVKAGQQNQEQKYYLINHSGSQEEVLQLLELLKKHPGYKQSNLPILINSPKDFSGVIADNVEMIHQYPAHSLFDQAKLIVTGCGYNSMIETLPFFEKHIFTPFERKFDNQFERAKRRNDFVLSNTR